MTNYRPPYIVPSEADGGHMIGELPANLSKAELRALGHPESPIKAIRAACLSCCGNQPSEVRKCTCTDCPLWPYRAGRNPFHGKARNNDDA